MNRREFILASVAVLQNQVSCNEWWKDSKMQINSLQVGIKPIANTEQVLSYSIDFSTLLLPPSNPVIKDYINPFGNAGVLPIQFNTVNLVLPQPGDSFQSIRSVAFQFRPYASSTGDYQQNPGKVRYQYIPYIVLYNNSTKQAIYLQAERLIMESTTVAAATSSYVPLLLVHQGAAPFFASLQDNIEVTLVNFNGANLGKVILQFFNFDVPPWYKTTFDQLVQAT